MFEKFWEFDCDLILNHRKIKKITITNHFQVKHSNTDINDVVKIIKKLDNEIILPTEYPGNRKVFRVKIKYFEKKYRLIFWLKDQTTNHLWIRNCYRID